MATFRVVGLFDIWKIEFHIFKRPVQQSDKICLAIYIVSIERSASFEGKVTTFSYTVKHRYFELIQILYISSIKQKFDINEGFGVIYMAIRYLNAIN